MQDLEKISRQIHESAGPNAKIVYVSGNFNILHPGHLRLLKFAAECGTFLAVGVHSKVGGRAYALPGENRLDALQSLRVVSFAFLTEYSDMECIEIIRPDVVVKGKEFALLDNPEKKILNQYGGKLLFSSGEVSLSVNDLIMDELDSVNYSAIQKPIDFLDRHSFSFVKLIQLVESFKNKKVIVIGDLIIDEYIQCDPLGMSREDPTIVVRPVHADQYIGGAGIVAAHSTALGAKTSLFSCVGNDQTALFAKGKLTQYGVTAHLLTDDSRPTTLKKRYRANGKTLLRVSELRQHDIEDELIDKVYEELLKVIPEADLVIFSDFNYGFLPQKLVTNIISLCKKHEILMIADSQSSSQTGDVSRFAGMDFISPTEHEARIALKDYNSGLISIAEMLSKKSHINNIIVTLAENGVLIHAFSSELKEYITDQIPALNLSPRDVSGAGDCLLIAAGLARVCGASIWEAAYLGSLAAACQVSREGNLPLKSDELIEELRF